MKIKSGFEMHEIAGKTIVVAVDERANTFNGMVTLSGGAIEIWRLLQEKDMTEDEIVSDLASRFEGDEQFIREDVRKFVGQLRENDFLDA